MLTNRGAPEARIVMPDLVGKDAQAVKERLEKFGFRVGSARYEAYEGVRPNTILKQFPPAGYPLSSREVVSLTVSRSAGGGAPAPRVMKVRIAPSLLSADFARLADALAMAEEGGADLVHVDVMDGHFVPNLTIGPPVVRALRKATRLPLDVHLMIENPERTLTEYLDAGADWVSVHVEATRHLQRCLDRSAAAGRGRARRSIPARRRWRSPRPGRTSTTRS